MAALGRLIGAAELGIDRAIVRVLPNWSNGVSGGVLLRGRVFEQLAERSAAFRKANNALFIAPFAKSLLSIVPLYSVLTGYPPVEMLDVKQTTALAFTGAVWTFYSFMVHPTAYLLGLVNGMLFSSNAYNLYRWYAWNRAHPQRSQS